MDTIRILNQYESSNLMICNATIDEEDKLVNICRSWKNKKELEGNSFTDDYISNSILKGNLPPIDNASKDNNRFQSIYLKKTNQLIGFIDMYLGFPKDSTLWIGMFIIDEKYQDKGYAHEVIELIENELKGTKYNEIGIGVYLKNWKGLRFWIKEGFTKINKITGDKEFSENTFAVISLEKSINVSRETF